MVIREISRVSVEKQGKDVAIYFVWAGPNGHRETLCWPDRDRPNYLAAGCLLEAAAAFLAGSATGQVVMAALSLVNVNLTREENEKGSIKLLDESELPF